MNPTMEEEEDLFFMEKACQLAEDSVQKGGGPFGSVIVLKDGTIVGQGRNQVTEKKDPTLHAEIVAIRNACEFTQDFRLSGCTLYSSCEPCPMCLSAIYWARIDKVVYGNTREQAKNIGFDDSFIYEEISKPIEERKIQMTHLTVDMDMTKNAFDMWSEKIVKIEY